MANGHFLDRSCRVGLLIVWGITSILAGVFPLDAPGAVPTLPGSIHNLVGLNFLLLAPAVLLIEMTHPSYVHPSRSHPITYWLAWLLLASAILIFICNGPLVSLAIGGLIQRLYWLVVSLWLLSRTLYIVQTAAHDAPA